MRKRLRHIVTALVLLLLAGVGGLVGRSLWQQSKRDLVTKGIEFLPGVSQHIQDFQRVKIKNGRKVWEVAAQDAQYFEDEKTVRVRDALAQWFLKDGRVVGLSGAEGRIILEGREIARLELEGDITMTLADYTVRTATATYDHAQDRISAPGAVDITSRTLHLTGDGMEVDVDNQKLRLLHNVSMQLQPGQGKQGGGDAPL